jgi:hypothetical protein
MESFTSTEQWALTQMIDSMATYRDPRDYIVDSKAVIKKITPQPAVGTDYQMPTPVAPPTPAPLQADDEVLF